MDIVILFKSEFWDDYFFLPYASIFYIINVNYVVLRKAYIYFLKKLSKEMLSSHLNIVKADKL